MKCNNIKNKNIICINYIAKNNKVAERWTLVKIIILKEKKIDNLIFPNLFKDYNLTHSIV